MSARNSKISINFNQFFILNVSRKLFALCIVYARNCSKLKCLWNEALESIIPICDLLQEGGPINFAFSTVFQRSQLSLSAFQKFDSKISYQDLVKCILIIPIRLFWLTAFVPQFYWFFKETRLTAFLHLMFC